MTPWQTYHLQKKIQTACMHVLYCTMQYSVFHSFPHVRNGHHLRRSLPGYLCSSSVADPDRIPHMNDCEHPQSVPLQLCPGLLDTVPHLERIEKKEKNQHESPRRDSLLVAIWWGIISPPPPQPTNFLFFSNAEYSSDLESKNSREDLRRSCFMNVRSHRRRPFWYHQCLELLTAG